MQNPVHSTIYSGDGLAIGGSILMCGTLWSKPLFGTLYPDVDMKRDFKPAKNRAHVIAAGARQGRGKSRKKKKRTNENRRGNPGTGPKAKRSGQEGEELRKRSRDSGGDFPLRFLCDFPLSFPLLYPWCTLHLLKT